ncbi:MAG: GNAT family N-acetyltransferase [Oscillospiraceae bacterium]|nr:GNAT family N-acetyltransferase [Oscillospiraceae bacterium]
MELKIKHFSELTLEELYAILKIRVDIFVVEQNCPYREIDGKDQNAFHIFLRDENGIAAYLRVLDKGVSFDKPALGRIVTTRRGKRYGAEIVKAGLKFAREQLGADIVKIEAQVYARGFYEKLGFRQCSEEILEDGIPHIIMYNKLS